MRAIIIQINVSLIIFSYLFTSSKYFKKVAKPADLMVKIMLILIPAFSVSILSLLAIEEVERYFILIISSHVIQSLSWAMALPVILMGEGYLLCQFGGEEFIIFGVLNEMVYNENINKDIIVSRRIPC